MWEVQNANEAVSLSLHLNWPSPRLQWRKRSSWIILKRQPWAQADSLLLKPSPAHSWSLILSLAAGRTVGKGIRFGIRPGFESWLLCLWIENFLCFFKFFTFNSSRVHTLCCLIEKITLKRLHEIIYVAISSQNDDGYLLMWRQPLVQEPGVTAFKKLCGSSWNFRQGYFYEAGSLGTQCQYRYFLCRYALNVTPKYKLLVKFRDLAVACTKHIAEKSAVTYCLEKEPWTLKKQISVSHSSMGSDWSLSFSVDFSFICWWDLSLCHFPAT